MASDLYSTVLSHPSLENCMAFILSKALGDPTMVGALQLMILFQVGFTAPLFVDCLLYVFVSYFSLRCRCSSSLRKQIPALNFPSAREREGSLQGVSNFKHKKTLCLPDGRRHVPAKGPKPRTLNHKSYAGWIKACSGKCP